MVGCVAAARGYDVLIGHDQVIRRLAPFLPRGIIFDKALGMAGDKKINRYHRLGYKLAAFDEESTGFLVNPAWGFSGRLSRESMQFADYWFCLSDKIRESANSFYPGFESKFVTSGLPRSDAFRSQFRELFEPDVRMIKQRHGKFILFCSNFGILIHGRNEIAAIRRENQDRGNDSGQSIYLEDILEQGKKNLDAFVEVLPKLRTWYPDHKLIIRPHPAERTGYWEELFAGKEGIEIIYQGISVPWILASQCLIHHGCTTGIEASMLSMPHIMYAPFPDAHHDTEVMKICGNMVHNKEDLKALMDRVLMHGKPLDIDMGKLEGWYANLTGQLVAETIVDALDRLDQKKARLNLYLSVLRFYPRHLFAQYWPRSKREAAYRQKKYPGIKLDEMQRMAGVIAAQLNTSLPRTRARGWWFY